MEPFSYRLKELYAGIAGLIEEFSPQEAAVEQVFVAKNAKSALKLGHARAAALLAALNMGLSVFEYTPLEIKKAVVGYGQAEKNQVRQMVRLLLNLSKAPALDASDALAAAICHANTIGLRSRMSLGMG
jgi:crossover junction endodeoxyribonuclease RuvC